jgi:hypothetical protein
MSCRKINLPSEMLPEFCRRHKIRRPALVPCFGTIFVQKVMWMFL